MMINSDNKKLTVAIIGAGMSGLIMAHAMIQRHANINVKLYEKTSDLTNIGGGFLIYPQGIRILKLLGFNNLVNELFVNITHFDIYNRKHQILLHEDLSHFYKEASAPLIPMSHTLLQKKTS